MDQKVLTDWRYLTTAQSVLVFTAGKRINRPNGSLNWLAHPVITTVGPTGVCASCAFSVGCVHGHALPEMSTLIFFARPSLDYT